MLTPSGVVKVLDFGLARAGEEVRHAASSDLRTMTHPPTAEGLVLGTAPYMSPEQARGHAVDRRTDVWAFGCVLYECLTDVPPFAGETVSDVVAHILEREPEWDALPATVPTRLRELVRRCLIKDRDDSPRDIGDLRRELKSIAQDLSSPGRPAPGGDRPSLAVLYFENFGGEDNEYFCSGITEDIVTDLSKIGGLRVASRNAVARYRGAPVDLGKVGAELGVHAVLEGSVRKAGNRVRITAQLIKASDGFHLWADRYDRTLEDVFAVQEEIASAIAAAMRVALTPAESEKLGADKPKDVRAYDLYLKGREQYGRYEAEALKQALTLFQQAIAIDAHYALAWAGLADTYGQLISHGFTKDPDEAYRLGLEAARRAIELNPEIPEGHKAEALILHQRGNLPEVKAALRRALRANPRFEPALLNLGSTMYAEGDVAGAERMIRRVLELDPKQPFAMVWLSAILGETGRAEESAEVATRMLAATSDRFYVTASYELRMNGLWARRDFDAIERLLAEGAAAGAETYNLQAVSAMLAAEAGRLDEVEAILQELDLVSGLNISSLVFLAVAALRCGRVDQAIGFMTKPVMSDLNHVIVRLTPHLHPLLGHSPFVPRQWDGVLVWPLEAPMIDPARFALFREVRIESGRPPASDVSVI
jgi:TolB-like protein/predicted Zn-dependent protease